MTTTWQGVLAKRFGEIDVVLIDTETTGIEDDAAVCEIAAVRFNGAGTPVARFSSLVNPGRPIPESATAVHGIRDEDVATSPKLEMLAGDLAKVCTGAIPAAFQAPFDKGKLHAVITGNDCLAFDPTFPWLDVFVMIASPKQDKYVSGSGRLKLTECCKRHEISLPNAHRAEGDAEAAGMLLYKIMGEKKPTIAAMVARMTEARAEQDRDYEQFRLRKMIETATLDELREVRRLLAEKKSA